VNVLVVNAGSSSLQLTRLDDGRLTAATTVERCQEEGHLQPVA
jgi:hypothetical protein